MAENNLNLNETFAAINGSRTDWQKIIENSTNPEQTFREIMWHIPAGIKYTTPNSELGNHIANLITMAAEELGVDKNEIFNEDGIIDFKELLAGGSKIEIETTDLTIWDGISFKEPDQDENGVYLIKTAANLAWLSKSITVDNTESKIYSLEADINLNDKDWTPIGNHLDRVSDANGKLKPEIIIFKGEFRGNNHTISNLKCNVENEYAKAGLFGYANGVIKDLIIENADITSTHYAGAFVAYNKFGSCTIHNCIVKNLKITDNIEYSTGKPDNGDKAGGIIGYAAGDGTYIAFCKVINAEIKAYRDLGGICGCAEVPSKNSSITFENNTIDNVKLIQDVTIAYKDFADVKEHYGSIYGWCGNVKPTIDNNSGEAEYELIIIGDYFEENETEDESTSNVE